MTYVPFDKDGNLAYTVDTRDWKAKIQMWFWKRFSKKISGKLFYGKLITGEKKVYNVCTFIRCKFENLKFVFIKNCYIEFETQELEIVNAVMTEIADCHLRQIEPLQEN